jgi:hypothetical protein
MAFSDNERRLLSLRVPDLLPDVDPWTTSDREFGARAATVGYGSDGFGDGLGVLLALLTILGAFGPRTQEENLELIRNRE